MTAAPQLRLGEIELAGGPALELEPGELEELLDPQDGGGAGSAARVGAR